MNCHGWQWALCWYFGGLITGCAFIVVWDWFRVNRALHILREDIRRDNPPAFRGGNHEH